MNIPVVTVITMTYKRFDGLEKTIKSVLSQDYPKIEYIISDDGSEEFDYNKIFSIIEKYKKSNICNIQIVHHESNIGTVKNINIASKKANGEYLIYIGLDDSFVSYDVISKIIERMRKSDTDLLSFSRILCDFNNKPLRLMPCKLFYKMIEKKANYRNQYKSFVTGFHYEMASGSGVCVKKTLLEKMNYYDESYVYWEDGPFFAKCNLNNIAIENAYDIIGINYKKGGISSCNSKAPSRAVLGLRKDADIFYKTEYIKSSTFLSKYDKRIIKYSLDRYENNQGIKKYLSIIKFFDIALLRYFYRLILKFASTIETLFFKSNIFN